MTNVEHNGTISIEGLTRRFGSLVAVDNISLSIPAGELFGLIGPDGAGKTTFLRMVAGVLAPTSGSVRIGGKTAAGSEVSREEIGYMSQRLGLYPDLTVFENVAFYAELYGITGSGRRTKIEEILSFGALSEFKNRRAGALSGGMKQKLALACTLVHAPRVLLLDEPTNGVDPVSRREFWKILHKLLQGGVSIVVTTSYLDEADRCHRVGLLRQGRLVACATPEEVRQLFPGRAYEIRVDHPRQTAEMLRSHFPTWSINLFGNRIRVLSPEAYDDAELLHALRQHGFDKTSLLPSIASLEDVFIWISSRG